MGTEIEKIRILIADDRIIVRAGLKRIFSATNDIVVGGEAVSASDTLVKVRQQDWDALLLDIQLSPNKGIDLIRRIRRDKPKLPILVLSARSADQYHYVLRALRLGAAGYLDEGCERELLIAVTRKVAAGGGYVDADMVEHSARDRAERDPHGRLTKREFQVFRMIVGGERLKQIAQVLSLSVKTISTHKTRILQKMGLTNAAELVRYAIAHRVAD